MNDELIFVKTASGEDAVRDRTRLVQRNLRMVLILVDGLTKVSALKQKAGDPAMIETALAELERIGLIESTETRVSRQASDVTEALSIASARSETSAVHLHEDFPTVDTVFEEVAPAVSSIDADTLIPSESMPPPKTAYASPPRASAGWFARLRDRWHQVREERTYEKAYGTPSGQESIAPPKAPPKRRRIGRRIKLAPIAMFLLVAAGVIGAVRVILYPYDEYRPTVEAHLSRMLADKVSVGSIKLAFTPAPTFTLQGVSAGRDSTAERISIIPSLGFLFGGQPIRTVRIEGLHIGERAFGKMATWLLPGSMGDFQLDRIEVTDLAVDLGWKRIRGLSGTLNPSLSGPVSFTGRSGEGDFEFEVTPVNAALAVSAKAGQWVVPLNPPLQVAAFGFKGALTPGNLVVTSVDARAFDGVVSGSGVVAWDSAPRMTLDLTLKHVSAVKLLEALHAPALVNGGLSGQIQYSANAPSTRWLGPNAKATGNVSVIHGSLKRMDLAGALRASGQRSAPHRGGETGFEELTGKFAADAGTVRVTDVRLSSGLMLASGQATVARDTGAIAGSVNVEMQGSARAPRASMLIGGDADAPELRTSR